MMNINDQLGMLMITNSANADSEVVLGYIEEGQKNKGRESLVNSALAHFGTSRFVDAANVASLCAGIELTLDENLANGVTSMTVEIEKKGDNIVGVTVYEKHQNRETTLFTFKREWDSIVGGYLYLISMPNRRVKEIYPPCRGESGLLKINEVLRKTSNESSLSHGSERMKLIELAEALIVNVVVTMAARYAGDGVDVFVKNDEGRVKVAFPR